MAVVQVCPLAATDLLLVLLVGKQNYRAEQITEQIRCRLHHVSQWAVTCVLVLFDCTHLHFSRPPIEGNTND